MAGRLTPHRGSVAGTFGGRRVLVTGAASGIGRAVALACARAGAQLYLVDLDGDRLRGTVAACEEIAAGCVRHSGTLDVSDQAAVAGLASEVHARDGALDIVMNVAGIATWGAVEKLEPGDWRRVIEVNLMGPINVIGCFVPPMIEAGRGGHLVNVASAAALFGLPLHAPYSASKFGLRGISEVLRFDLRRQGIAVSLVCPGGVDTQLVETVNIVGVDRGSPRVQRTIGRFRSHAVTPERAAAAILHGVARRRYMIYTSNDIRFGHWVQRKWAYPYELAMRVANAQVRRLLSAG